MHLCSALDQSLFCVGGISGLNEMMAGVGDQMCCQGLPLIPFLQAVASEESSLVWVIQIFCSDTNLQLLGEHDKYF